MLYLNIATKSDTAMYRLIKHGGYYTVMKKTMLELAIPIQKAFIRLVNGETHHVQRNVAKKQITMSLAVKWNSFQTLCLFSTLC